MPETPQDRFVAALRDASLPPPEGVIGRRGEAPLRRFAVYRNNVHVSLVEALMNAYPVVTRLVGEAFFRAMARVYCGLELPKSPVLIHYGESFPAFIDAFEPARSVPYLGDVARLEWAWSRAYHAADAEPVSLQVMATVPAERTADVVLELHPSLRLVASDHPILEIWQANRADGEATGADLAAGGGEVLVLRPAGQVEMRRLPAGAGAFLRAVAVGEPVGSAYARAVEVAPGFDLPGHLAALFAMGAVTGYRFARAHMPAEAAS